MASDAFADQSASAQAAFSALSQALMRARVERCAADLPGGFARKTLRGRDYWYYQLKAPDGRPRQIYIGQDDETTRSLIEQHAGREPLARDPLCKLSRAAAELGCYRVIPKHFRVVQRLADHGLFEAGAMLVGTHAFLAFQNALGVHWFGPGQTVDQDFAHPGRNLSVAMVPDARIDARSAIDSLQMGFVPISSGTSFNKPDEQDFDLDFLTSRMSKSDEPIACPALNVNLQPLRFMEFSLKDPVPCALIGNSGSVLVNLPRPERYAVHKLLICGERPASQALKARKDVAQALTLIGYFRERDPQSMVDAWHEAAASGPAWRKALSRGVARAMGEHRGSVDMLEQLSAAAGTPSATGRLSTRRTPTPP